jgi:L-iditol 2-dehydrogenase
MKVAVYHGPNDIRMQEMPTPEINEDEVLVKMRACGVCGSDLMDWYLKDRSPLVLGHEPTGVIAEKGAGVTDFNVADRIFVHHHVACLRCYYCLRGDYTLCEQFHTTNIKPGGFAEYFKVPAPNVRLDTLKIPNSLSFEEATLIEPVACCFRALNKCKIEKGDSVAVVGAGVTGLIHTVLAKILGASKVFVSDLIKYRLDVAKELGADVVINSQSEDLPRVAKCETEGRGVDVVVVTAPNLEAYKAGLNGLRRGGRLCVFAPTEPAQYLQLSPKDLFFSETQIIPSYSTSHIETKAALQLLTAGRINTKALITHRFPLVETADAFKAARERESLKVVVLNDS